MARIAVLGAGMMGSAFCVPMVDRGHEVRLVGTHLDVDIIDGLRRDGSHLTLRQKLPNGITPFQHDEFEAAMDGADVLVLGVSSAGVAWAGEKTAPVVRPGLPVISITKGLVWTGERFRILPDVLTDHWPEPSRSDIRPGAVAGPCIAGELALRVPTTVVFTSRDRAMVEALRGLFSTDYYEIRISTDVVGIEVCAALKNAYALAVGFAAGLNDRRGQETGSVAMHNHEASVFAQAAIEMARIVQMLGGDPVAAHGLPGVGDLFVTCQGGRTSRLGRWLGSGLTLSEAIEKMEGATLESLDIIGVWADAIPTLEDQDLLGPDELPLMRHLCAMVTEDASADVPFGRFFQQMEGSAT